MKDMSFLLLELGANPNDKDRALSTTSLQDVVIWGAWDLYGKFVHHPRINLDLRNSAGRAVLHYLVQFADFDTLSHFLNLPEFDVNVQDNQGNTPLHVATTLRKLDVMKRLLDVYGIRLDLTDNMGRTPLTVATYWGYHDAALVLIEHSKAFPTPERGQLSSLICAAKQDDLDLTQILLDKYRYQNLDYHIDLSGKGVLHYVAINNWAHVLERILSHGDENTNVNKIDHSGGSALHCAAALGNTACCEILLKHGASARLQDRNGRTAAHAAADAGFMDTLTVLVRADDVDVNQRDHQGRNLVHWAATIDCVDVMEEVLQRQPTVEIARRDNMGRMPMDIAFICKCPNVGRFLEREMGLRRATSLWVNIYNWDGLYSNAVVELDGTTDEKDDYWRMREDSLLFRESIRKKGTEKEWEDLHRRYPDERWALVTVPKDEHPSFFPLSTL
jgi:ankyrin repeat protein